MPIRLHFGALRRLLSSIRLHEVLPLQGSPAVGAALAMKDFGADHLPWLAVLLAASCCLVAHVFVFNDWAGIEHDLRNPQRASHAFTTKGVSRAAVGRLAAMLLVAGLVFSGLLGLETFLVALGVLAASTLYSAPWPHLKSCPVINTLLHFAGGLMHFLMGYSALAPIDGRSLAVGCFFGLVFAAGHLMHETRDHDGDLLNGLRTNAVAFGMRPAFIGGLVLFMAAYWWMVGLALAGALPRLFVLAAVASAVHLHVSLRTYRSGMNPDGLRRLQRSYHLIIAAIGLLLIATALLS